MIEYTVALSPAAVDHLEEIRSYIAGQGSPENANGYIQRIIDHCETLTTFPYRGRPREDLLRNARSISFEGRATIAYRVTGRVVEILAIAYAGRDLATLLR